jgi:hypothetical protein
MLVLGALALLSARPVGAQQTPDLAPYLMDDRAAEVALARSAAPGNVSDSAAVLVLTRTGYVQAVAGTNSFTCAVLRSFLGPIGDPNSWNPRVRAPHCFNRPAALTMLPVIKARAAWVMAGLSETEIGARVRSGYAHHQLPMPASGAMAYMMSHEQYLANDDPHWMPHVMFYYGNAMSAAALGAGRSNASVIDVSGSDPYSPVLTIAIPVRQWSDGTPALTGSSHQE